VETSLWRHLCGDISSGTLIGWLLAHILIDLPMV
jgi:hypothetical protein